LLSSYIDGTAIYGLDSVRSNALRSFSGGALLTSSGVAAVASAGLTSRTYLPLSTSDSTCTACYTYNNCTTKNTIYNCFLGGEWRTSENLALTSIQTLFNREHNRIAATLASLNPTWSDETIYQQTRRIVIAELQDIVFGEFVPLINGSTSLSPLSSGYYSG
jgi:peroxidase